jgi:hypothetical protein
MGLLPNCQYRSALEVIIGDETGVAAGSDLTCEPVGPPGARPDGFAVDPTNFAPSGEDCSIFR